MRIQSFIIAYALVLALLLFADRRPKSVQQDRYSHVVDLTETSGENFASRSRTKVVAPDALIRGTWTAGQIPAERLIAPLVVMDLNVAPPAQISLDDIATWETQHGAVPPGSVVAVRRSGADHSQNNSPHESSPQEHFPHAFPMTDQAAEFLMDARYTTGFAIEQRPEISTDRRLARQLALHGNYVVEGTSRLTALPATGSLIIVAPAKDQQVQNASVRVLAMVR
ncbi:MAG: cyclase family protein [Terriglobales bacterium]